MAERKIYDTINISGKSGIIMFLRFMFLFFFFPAGNGDLRQRSHVVEIYVKRYP